MADEPVPDLRGWDAYCSDCAAFREARLDRDVTTGSKSYDFVCSVCNAILLTFRRLRTQSEETEPARLVTSARCPHCGKLNVFPGFTAYVCQQCGRGVDSTLRVH